MKSFSLPTWKFVWQHYVYAVGLVVLVQVINLILGPAFSLANASMLFLLIVICCAYFWGVGVSLVSALLSSVLLFYYLTPMHRFAIDTLEGLLTLLVFVFVALLISQLTSRIRHQASQAAHRERMARSLYQFSRRIAAGSTLLRLVEAIVEQMSTTLSVPVALCLPQAERLTLMHVHPAGHQWDQLTWAAAQWCWNNQQTGGCGTQTFGEAAWFFMPLTVAEESVGLIALQAQGHALFWQQDTQHLLHSLANQAAVAIVRMKVEALEQKNKLLAESDRLRSALLSSVSHDLRTPLASVMGSITSLQNYYHKYSDTTRGELLDSAHQEAKRLDCYIGNLLYMAKLETGALALTVKEVGSEDILAQALDIFATALTDRTLTLEVASALPLVYADPILTEKVFINVLENALKYSPEGTAIRIAADVVDGTVQWQFGDQGVGMQPEQLTQVFDLFYRAEKADRVAAGSGMGLAICKGLVEAQGGKIWATSQGINQGSCFFIALPVQRKTYHEK